jgi:uncharacterized cupredoxin-like copper-binding protein
VVATLHETDEPESPAEPAGRSEILMGGNQAGWLAVVTVMALLALVFSTIALLRSSGETIIIQGGGGAATSASFEGGEFFFEPANASVVGGVPVEITLDNTGAVDHELVVLKAGVTIATERDFSEDMVLAQIDAIGAGQVASTSVTFETPGTYQIACLLPGHFDGGMKGTITVS